MTLLHFIIFILIEFIFIQFLIRNTIFSDRKIAIFTSILLYVLIVSYVFYLNYKYKVELNKFDLNNDGFFNGNEINSEQKKAMRNVISDAGRNFAPITAIFYTTVHYFILKMILRTFNIRKNKTN
uniref:hypothetical protein n=1 Tax=Flavobacterium sp. TaxID=239 RepID=UPI00404B4206